MPGGAGFTADAKEEDQRTHHYAVLSPAAIAGALRSGVDLPALPDSQVDAASQKAFAEFLKDLPQLGPLAIAALGWDASSTKINGVLIRDGKLQLRMEGAKGTAVWKGVLSDGRLKVAALEYGVLWKFDPSFAVLDQSRADEAAAQAGQVQLRADKRYEKKNGRWTSGPLPAKNEAAPASDADHPVVAAGKKALGALGSAAGYVSTPFQDAFYAMTAYGIYGMGVVTGTTRDKLDGIYTQRQAPLNATFGDPSLATEKERDDAYQQALAVVPKEELGEFDKVVGERVQNLRRAALGDLYDFNGDAAVTDRERADAAASLFGLGNIPKEAFAEGQARLQRGETASGIGYYSVGAAVVGTEAWFGSKGFGLAAGLAKAGVVGAVVSDAARSARVVKNMGRVEAALFAVQPAMGVYDHATGLIAAIKSGDDGKKWENINGLVTDAAGLATMPLGVLAGNRQARAGLERRGQGGSPAPGSAPAEPRAPRFESPYLSYESAGKRTPAVVVREEGGKVFVARTPDEAKNPYELTGPELASARSLDQARVVGGARATAAPGTPQTAAVVEYPKPAVAVEPQAAAPAQPSLASRVGQRIAGLWRSPAPEAQPRIEPTLEVHPSGVPPGREVADDVPAPVPRAQTPPAATTAAPEPAPQSSASKVFQRIAARFQSPNLARAQEEREAPLTSEMRMTLQFQKIDPDSLSPDQRTLYTIMSRAFPETVPSKQWLTAHAVPYEDIPTQGVKLRVADPGTPAAREELARWFVDFAGARGNKGAFDFKIAFDVDKLKGAQQGKFITIYASDPVSAKNIAVNLSQKLTRMKLDVTPNVPSDEFSFGGSGLVSWRYGEFKTGGLHGTDSSGQFKLQDDRRDDPVANLQFAEQYANANGLDFWSAEARRSPQWNRTAPETNQNEDAPPAAQTPAPTGGARNRIVPAFVQNAIARVFPGTGRAVPSDPAPSPAAPLPPGSVEQKDLSYFAKGGQATVYRVEGSEDLIKVYNRLDYGAKKEALVVQRQIHDQLRAENLPVQTVPVAIVFVGGGTLGLRMPRVQGTSLENALSRMRHENPNDPRIAEYTAMAQQYLDHVDALTLHRFGVKLADRPTNEWKPAGSEDFTNFIVTTDEGGHEHIVNVDPFNMGRYTAMVAKGKIIPRSTQSADRVSVDLLRANSRLANDKRAEAAQAQMGLPPEQAMAVQKAHNDVECPVGRCSNAQKSRKMKIMMEAGLTPQQAREAIERGLAGGAASDAASPERQPVQSSAGAKLLAPLKKAWGRFFEDPAAAQQRQLAAREQQLQSLRPSPEQFAAALETYKKDHVELLDESGSGERSARAREINGDDLFNADLGFRGTLMQMVEKNVFRSDTVYKQGNGYNALTNWWTSARILGNRSRSPLVRLYGEKYGADNLERSIYWQNRASEPNDTQSGPVMAPLAIRVAVNQARTGKFGVLQDLSLEAFARDPKTGEWEPFFFVKKGDQWVMSETFEGKPVKQACMGCHSVTEKPQSGGKATRALYPFPLKVEGFQTSYPRDVRRMLRDELGLADPDLDLRDAQRAAPR